MTQHSPCWELNLKILSVIQSRGQKGLASMILAIYIISLTELQHYFFFHLLGNNLYKNFEAKLQLKEFTTLVMCTDLNLCYRISSI